MLSGQAVTPSGASRILLRNLPWMRVDTACLLSDAGPPSCRHEPAQRFTRNIRRRQPSLSRSLDMIVWAAGWLLCESNSDELF